MEIYYKNYWLAGKCDQLTAEPIAVIAFDICVNNGVGRSAKMLQQAVGATVDGQIGPNTLAAVNGADVGGLIRKLNDIRVARYNQIVQNDPTQQKFINGWMRRVAEVTQYALSLLHS
jgi:lysozyme family protein